jgi:ribonucleoside-diphosphate reductase alpha chain
MKISRLFTSAGQNGLEGITFAPRDCEIREGDEVSFSQKGWIFPTEWSQAACDLAAQKYFRKAGAGFAGETDLRQVIARMVGCWKKWGQKLGYFSSPEDATNFEAEMTHQVVRQMASPNSPQWFNTGLHSAYGIEAEAQGHFFIDEKTGKARPSVNAYEHPQVHACFIQSVKDDLVNPLGIMDLWVREARVFKFGSGTGTNFSDLRGVGESLEGGGVSSGLMAFLRVGDVSAGSVRSGGITRRAAKMVCLDLDHPEIEAFVQWKAQEERRVAELVAGSFTTRRKLEEIWQHANQSPYELHQWREVLSECALLGIPPAVCEQARDLGQQGIAFFSQDKLTIEWRGEAYRSVFGQNANTSVRVPTAFLQAVKAGGAWTLRARKDRQPLRSLEAEKLWDEIALAAWTCADPGVQYQDLISDWHTCPQSGEIRASNPCSEYLFLDDTGCNLASLNLMKFWHADSGQFESEKFAHACRLWTLTLEISVAMAQYPSAEIAQRSHAFRTLGLGFANLGALLMAAGLPYDSDRGRALAGAIASLMAAAAWNTSADMAKELGAFSEFKKNEQACLRVLRNHARAAGALEGDYEGLTVAPRPVTGERPAYITEVAARLWKQALEKSAKSGVRNAQLTAIAPTGTIGLVMDCDTTGIEPEFSLVKYKTLAGGGSIRSTNRTISLGLKRLGYTSEQIKAIESALLKPSASGEIPHLRPEDRSVFAVAESHQGRIAVEGHLAMVAAVQPFISGGISKTVSIPHQAEVAEIRRVFELAHDWMVKCVSVYRNGSKLSQPLTPEICFECG